MIDFIPKIEDRITISQWQWEYFDKRNGNWKHTDIAYAYEYHPDFKKGEAIAVLTPCIKYSPPSKEFPYGRALQTNGNKITIYITMNSRKRIFLLTI